METKEKPLTEGKEYWLAWPMAEGWRVQKYATLRDAKFAQARRAGSLLLAEVPDA